MTEDQGDMDFGFLRTDIKKTAFSKRPFSILDHSERDAFTSVMEILLLETADRAACEEWQEQQLVALLSHAKKRSGFWRNRSGLVKPSLRNLRFLPVLLREDVTEQVNTEGALLTKGDKIAFKKHATSGSSGTPVNFFVSAVNSKYNGMRSFVQSLLEQRDLQENSTKIYLSVTDANIGQKNSIKIETTKNRRGPLSSVFEEGAAKTIYSVNSDEKLVEELRKQTPHNIVCSPSIMDVFLNIGGTQLLTELGVKRWIQLSEGRTPEIDKEFKDAGISISANYSTEEVGPVAFECPDYPGYYHVATSNVVVEVDDSVTTEVDGEILSRVLLTHLHSYATPFIRYDVGDFAKLTETCRCGHDGPTLSNIYGRAKRFILFADGRYIPFNIRAKSIFERVNCTEFQIHQKDLNTIVFFVGGRESLSEKEKSSLVDFMLQKTEGGFQVEIRPVKEIDWQGNPKKLGFTSAVA